MSTEIYVPGAPNGRLTEFAGPEWLGRCYQINDGPLYVKFTAEEATAIAEAILQNERNKS